MSRTDFTIAAVLDTETTNYSYQKGNDIAHTAWCVLYTVLDLRGIDIASYEVGDGDCHLYRHEEECMGFLLSLIAWGRERGVCPVVCGYNLMFDMQTLMFDLNTRYHMSATAQSATNAYVVDVLADVGGRPLLRFWDTFHLEMRGLAAMGETAGVPKLYGDWDYTLVRTPDTPLSDDEMRYAAYDTYIIPAYLRYLLESNAWLRATDLASNVMTKTSIVRTFSKREIGALRVDEDGPTLYQMFTRTCESEFWPDFDSYALQRACFRGGFTFTAARLASQLMTRVYSLDETSAHHAFINGRYIPVGFKRVSPRAVTRACEAVVETKLDAVLDRYECPWLYGLHARVRFRNIRLKRGSAFAAWGIALSPQGKFSRNAAPVTLDTVPDSPRNASAEEEVKGSGYIDEAVNPIFAFSKLMSADECVVCVSEVELYAMSLVYEWDEMEALCGEVSTSWQRPPDYVTLQSNVLFAQKQGMKSVLRDYVEGVFYNGKIDERIPEAIRAEIASGTASRDFLVSYYNSTVKGMFNGIYGVQAQNVMRPDYKVEYGDLLIDDATKVTRDNFESRAPKRKKVLYTYGLRIVGGSRLQLVIAIKMIYDSLGEHVRVVGGDTDSLKVSCDESVGPDDLLEALRPLHEATRAAIARTQRRVREEFPKYVSSLKSVGEFEIENVVPYPEHVELWNKARVTWDGSHAHVTCAGLSRPVGAYTIESAIDEYVRDGHSFFEAVSVLLGYNTYIDPSISHALERTRPTARDRVRLNVTDYTGVTRGVDLPEAICLYDAPRNVADTNKRSNFFNVKFLKSINVSVDTSEKLAYYKDGRLHVEKMTESGWDEL